MDAFFASFRGGDRSSGGGSGGGSGGTGKAVAALRTLRVVTYNVDGLCDRMRRERAAAVTRLLVALEPQPDVVALQEVVPETVALFAAAADHMGMEFYSVPEDTGVAMRYFNALAVRRGAHVTPGAVRIVAFPTSVMGRHAVTAEVTMWGMPMSFAVSHLESLRDYSAERTRQWRIMAAALAASPAALAVFTGDTNLRDAEVGVLAPGVTDAWLAVGSPAASRWTWDLTINKNTAGPTSPGYKARFDRLYYRANPVDVPLPSAPAAAAAAPPAASSSSGGVIDLTSDSDGEAPSAPPAAAAAAAPRQRAAWRATSFTLLGLEACVGTGPAAMHPSDHFGVCCDFVLEAV